MVLLSCSGFQCLAWVKGQPQVAASACAHAWGFWTPPGDCAHHSLFVLIFSFWTDFRTWANSTNVIQHRYVLLLKKFCIISPTQKKTQTHRDCIMLSSVPTCYLCAVLLSASGFPLTQDLFMAWGTRFSCSNSPVPQPCPSMHLNVLMANGGVALPTAATPDLPFLKTLVSSPGLAEVQGGSIGFEWNQNCILIVNICPEINVSELMFLSNQCIQKQMTLANWFSPNNGRCTCRKSATHNWKSPSFGRYPHNHSSDVFACPLAVIT